MKESDLYLPVKAYLEGQGYEVKGEVRDCDVLAIRGDEPPVVVELKTNLNLDVVLQAVSRLTVSSAIYVGIPRGTRMLAKHRKRILKLFKMLGFGLLTVDPRSGRVDVFLDPGTYRPRPSKRRQQLLLAEFEKRVGDPNLGGTDRRRGMMTSYRQQAIVIASYLKEAGPTRAAEVASEVGEPKAREIMYRNVYGWFDRPEKGIYALSPRGERELEDWNP